MRTGCRPNGLRSFVTPSRGCRAPCCEMKWIHLHLHFQFQFLKHRVTFKNVRSLLLFLLYFLFLLSSPAVQCKRQRQIKKKCSVHQVHTVYYRIPTAVLRCVQQNTSVQV